MTTKRIVRPAFAFALACAVGGIFFLSGPVHASADDSVTAIKVARIHVGNGEVIEPGIIIIENGRITAVGADVNIPGGAKIIDMPEGSVTPGLIDANALLEPDDAFENSSSASETQQRRRRRGVIEYMMHDGHSIPVAQCFMCDGTMACSLANYHDDLEEGQVCPICGQNADGEALVSGLVDGGSGPSLTEGSSEVVPNTFIIDSVNFASPDFDRLVRGGVTTVFASPDSAAVIGPRGAVVKTAGPLSERVLNDAADVKATIGNEPSRSGGFNRTPNRGGVSLRARRPNSRMGVVWVFRKAFIDAESTENGRWLSGADQATPEALDMVSEIRAGAVPLRIQARTQRDILTAIRVADEFGLSFTLLEGTEAYECLNELRAKSIPVVFGPVYEDATGIRARSGEADESRLSTMRQLLDAGITTALSAQDLREEDGLARQAMYAMRAGLTREEALRAVTLTPAEMLGIDDQLGSIETGKQADLILWSGEPFDATSQPLTVFVNGKVAFSRK
ncbi:MAG: amidohydrolase family protein [Phycisphaerales bacterium]